MENQQSMSCESLLADLERVVVLRKNAKAPRIDTLDKIMKATVQKLQDAFHLETQAGLSESRILEYLDCTTRARQVIASYQRAPFSSALWKEQQCNGIHTCVDMFFARLLNSLDGTIAPETVKDVDNIMALERLADIEKKHNGWMGPPTSIGVIIEQKMALALEKASLVLPAEKDDNKEQTKDSVLHFVSIDRTHLTLEEHHNVSSPTPKLKSHL